MADLDKYLENIGISTHDDDTSQPNGMAADGMAAETADSSEPLIGAARYIFEPLQGDARQRCESFLARLLLQIDPVYAVEVQEKHESSGLRLEVEIFGGDIGRLIGKNGRTLAALEYITYMVVNNGYDDNVRVSIDTGNYKQRQHDKIRHIALQAANRVRKTGFAVELDPMPPAERRMVHMVIADEYAVMSESSGEGRGRRVVIKPA